MSHLPRLAVIITSYNYERYIGEAIESVTRQNRDDVEIVVVDDGSTDGSWNVVSNFPEVRSVRVPNGGPVSACVHGLDLTNAPFVLFLDSDDRLEPGSLAFILGKLDRDVAKLQFSLGRIDAEGHRVFPAFRTLADFRERDRLIEEVRSTGSYLTPPTSGNVFRRDVADLLREVDYKDASADGVTSFAAPFFGDVVSVSVELGMYRIHGRNATAFGRIDVDAFDWETRRFVDAMLHLRRVLDRLGQGQHLPNPTVFYTYRERVFCRSIAAGERPSRRHLPALLAALARQKMSGRNKVAMAIFFCLATVVPKARAKALLAYRHKTTSRTVLGFLKTALVPLPQISSDKGTAR